MDMAKEKKECEIMTMLIIMKKVINPLEVGEEEEVETILEEQMQRGMINPMLNVIIVISMVIFLGSVEPMLKKFPILLVTKKKMKSQHYCYHLIMKRIMKSACGILTMAQVITCAVTRRKLWSLKKR